jgi:hypothetical protein
VSDDLVPDETIYVTSTHRAAVHTDRDCHLLENCERDVTRYDRSEFPDLPVCRECRGVVDRSNPNPWERVKALEEA